MQPIPAPQLLDPDRIGASHRIDANPDYEQLCAVLDEELHQSCAYAQQLWHELDAMRAYLLHSLPPDPSAPDPPSRTSASPTGPDDDAGWDNWISAYAAVTSTLCGAHGDSGYGLSEGRQLAQQRRTAPQVLHTTDTPNSAHRQRADTTPSEGSPDHPSVQGPAPHIARAAGLGILLALAARGLRRSPRRSAARSTA
jgi:hypothetical protein